MRIEKNNSNALLNKKYYQLNLKKEHYLRSYNNINASLRSII